MKNRDYIRTEKYISKIINITNGETQMLIGFNAISVSKYKEYWLENGSMIFESEIIKSSPNIIDLIEVGDYVNRKLVGKIEDIYTTDNIYIGKFLYEKNCSLIGGEEDIKSIVTKEQFEAMKYEIK